MKRRRVLMFVALTHKYMSSIVKATFLSQNNAIRVSRKQKASSVSFSCFIWHIGGLKVKNEANISTVYPACTIEKYHIYSLEKIASSEGASGSVLLPSNKYTEMT